MATRGDDLEHLSGAVVLSRLSDSSDEEDDSSDSMDAFLLEWIQVSLMR